jgi:hypothetical protein
VIAAILDCVGGDVPDRRPGRQSAQQLCEYGAEVATPHVPVRERDWDVRRRASGTRRVDGFEPWVER